MLRLNEADSYGELINVTSTRVPRVLRVVPGNPDASWLQHKINNTMNTQPECQGDAGVMVCGESMPQRGELLPADERDLIRRWIVAGAPR
jgi:hypothetical protein